jgi:hypothetical protein
VILSGVIGPKMKPLQTAPAKWPIAITAAILLLLLAPIAQAQPWDCASLPAERLQREVQSGDRLDVERLGGHDRAGLPGSHVESRGGLALSKLSPADREAIEDLFNNPEKIKKAPSGAADFERYCITRLTAAGLQTIEVPFNAAPAVVRESVTDRLK